MPDDRSQLILQELVRRSNDEIRRLRELEQKIQSIESRTISLENTILLKTKNYEKKISDLDASIKSFSDDVERMRSLIEKINKHMSKFASKREIKELEKMMELLTPSKGYVLKKVA